MPAREFDEHPHPQEAEATLLLELGRRVTASLDLEEVLDRSLEALRGLVPPADGGAIRLVIDGAVAVAASDPVDGPAPMSAPQLGEGLAGRVSAEGQPLYCPDVHALSDADARRLVDELGPRVRSVFACPLILRGETLGVVEIHALRPRAFDQRHRSLLLAFSPTIAAAVQNAMLFRHEAQARERAQELQRLKRDFLAVATHELRTPLTSILGFAQLLASERDTTPEQARALGRQVLAAGRRLSDLVEDLLEGAGITRGEVQVRLDRIDVAALLEDIASEPAYGRVRLEVEPGLPFGRADRRRLAKVARHLLDNALKFSAEDSPVVAGAHTSGREITVTVTDTGPGIPPELQGKVFERFYQVDQSATRPVGGMGLGLFLVRQLCRQMGVEVDLDSEPGRGTCVSLRLPCA